MLRIALAIEAAVSHQHIFDIIKDQGDSDVGFSRMSTDEVAKALGVSTKEAYRALKAAEKAGYVKSGAKDLKRKNVQSEDYDHGVGYALWEVYFDDDGQVKLQLDSNYVEDFLQILKGKIGVNVSKGKFTFPIVQGTITGSVSDVGTDKLNVELKLNLSDEFKKNTILKNKLLFNLQEKKIEQRKRKDLDGLNTDLDGLANRVVSVLQRFQ